MKKLVALLLTFLLVLAGCNMVEVTKVEDDTKTDAIRFSKEYELNDNNNIYVYATYDNVMDTIESGSGIIYLGFPSCDLCTKIVPVLNKAAKEKNIDEILYYNFKDIRENNTDEYRKLTNVLSDYIKDDEEKSKIKAPTIVFVNNGNIIGVYVGVLSSDAEEILTEEEKSNLKSSFLSLIDKMLIEKTNEEVK